MALQLYNTRTHRVEPFLPLREKPVRIYVCGLTPSAQAHLGHARSFLFFDLLRRYLRHRGFAVTFVQNVTDIDDRSIATAHMQRRTWREVVAEFYASFKESMRKLGILEPDIEPYATKFIPEILTTIGQLVERGNAYVAADGVYYRVSSFARYGELSRRNIEELRAGARVEVDERKADPLDFALWKFAKPGEPEWPSPWGAGRPGWHIECSAMAHALLDPDGTGFDIHGGGTDLIFPHHENEIAQSEPLMTHPPMANVWLHGGLLLFDHRKMSKSLGNFEPLSDLLERHDPQAVRLLFLQTGYRKVMNFTEESIVGATTALEKLRSAYRSLYLPGVPPQALHSVSLLSRVEAALDDDMNTAVALGELHGFAANVHSYDAQRRSEAFATYCYVLELLGLTPDERWLAVPAIAMQADLVASLHASLGAMIDEKSSPQAAIEGVILARTAARGRRDFAESDRLRDALADVGIVLNDSKEGTTWCVDR